MIISRFRNWLARVFYFNRQERNGVLLLCLLLGAVIIVRLALPPWLDGQRPMNPVVLVPETPRSSSHSRSGPAHEKPSAARHREKFVFNPNTVSAEDAMSLGFPKKLAITLTRFRNKGGKFRSAEDLRKLYGMSPALFRSLEPYVLIPASHPEARRDSFHRSSPIVHKSFPKSLLELNGADSLSILYLKGIGPGFTKRILKYRTLLGGFHAVEQLREIYGMNDSTYQILVSQTLIDKSLLLKIPVNEADVSRLRKHPYLNFQLAQAIVNFRSKHGRLSEADVISLGIIPADKLKLLLPYFSY